MGSLEAEVGAIFATVCGTAEYMTKEQLHFVALAAGLASDVHWETEYATLLQNQKVDASIGWTVVDFMKLIEQKWCGAGAKAVAQDVLVKCVLHFRTPPQTMEVLWQWRSQAHPAAAAAPQQPPQQPPAPQQDPQEPPAPQRPPTPPPGPPPPPQTAAPPPAQPPGPPPCPPPEPRPFLLLEPRQPLPLVELPPPQPLAVRRCAWHEPLGQYPAACREGYGNARHLSVHHDNYNEYKTLQRCIELNSHLENTLFLSDMRGYEFLAAKCLKHVRDGDLLIVACKTQANRFVQYQCKCCGDYVVAKHGKHASEEAVALARCRVLWFFQFSQEVSQRPQPGKPVL